MIPRFLYIFLLRTLAHRRNDISVNSEKPLMRSIRLLLFLAIALSVFSCTKKTDTLTTDALSDYIPLTPGSYITYRVDSLVFTNFGRNEETHKYQIKHVIDSQIADNMDRPSYRVYRYIRDSAGTESWQPAGSYFITPLAEQVELIEDNLRFIKLHLPITDGFSWKGNSYLPQDPYGSQYNFSNDDNMPDWDFRIDGELSQFSFDGNDYPNTLSIEEDDESYNYPIVDPTSYASRTRAVEKYSKGVGLVYRDYQLWEYQPNTTGTGGPYKTGFGITMWMIDHN